MIKQFLELLEIEKDIIPFLKKLEIKEKRELVPDIIKLYRKYNKGSVKQIGERSYQWGYDFGTDVQRDILEKTAYVCFNKTDAFKLLNHSNLSIKKDYLDSILSWYTPSWYNESVNHLTQMDYLLLMELKTQGNLQPKDELIVNSFINSLYLENYPETLEKHFWLIFEYETSINWGNSIIWVDRIVSLSDTKKIDRLKLLKATINTSSKGFNKLLTGWFTDLFVQLEPAEKELLTLQEELFSVFACPQSKYINEVLKLLKKLCVHKSFDKEGFIEQSSILLTSPTKGIVNTTLMILDKLAKTNDELHQEIVLKVTESLISTDEKIQSRACKLIQTYGDSKDEGLVCEVNMYIDTLYASSKNLLFDFLTEEFEIEEELFVEKINILSKENEIERATSFDDLLFFVNQSFDNNQVYDLELLYASLPKLYSLITKENVSKLESLFRRAFKTSTNFDFGKKTGFLDAHSCRLINDFALLLEFIAKEELSDYYEWRKIYFEDLDLADWHYQRIKDIVENIPIEKQSLPNKAYRTHHILMQQSKKLMLDNKTLDLLSTPTHKPCWLDPLVLIERINTYEKEGVEVNTTDFQIAIGRLPDTTLTTEIKEVIDSIKNINLKKVFQYHFGQITIEDVGVKPCFLLQSVLSRNNENEMRCFEESTGQILRKQIGDYPWEVEVKVNTYQGWDYKKKAKVEISKRWSKIMMKYKKHPKSTYESVYNDYNFMTGYYREAEPNDVPRYMILTPNNLGPICRLVVNENLRGSKMWAVNEQITITNSIKTLFDVWNRNDYNEMTYLFLGACFVTELKGVREYTAELFIKNVTANNIDIKLLGEILGKLEVDEYAPLKRFTDLIVSNLLNISKQHNFALFVLIDTMLSRMNKTPVKGFKKLLELFYELKVNQNDYVISEETNELFSFWKETKSLNSIVKKIEKLV